jgi:cytochrome bd ubiquinol oxidase subunit I
VATGLRFGIALGALLIPLQILAGDLHGLNTLEHQPQKVAAMEGNWETRSHAPLVLFALPDEAARTNRLELAVPSGASLILKHDPAGVVPGLNDFVAEDGSVLHPPVAPVFWSFRVMVGIGLLMLVTSWAGAWLWWRRGIEKIPRLYLGWLTAMTFSGWVATLAGWYVTEIGRQPWLVHGVLDHRRGRGPGGGRHGFLHVGRLSHHICAAAGGLCGSTLPSRAQGTGACAPLAAGLQSCRVSPCSHPKPCH